MLATVPFCKVQGVSLVATTNLRHGSMHAQIGMCCVLMVSGILKGADMKIEVPIIKHLFLYHLIIFKP